MSRREKRSKFKYKRRDSSTVKNRGEGNSSNRDYFLKEGTDLYGPKDGDNTIRFLPPTWEDADHYGLDIFVHYRIGSDNNSYLCPQRMKKEPCPICEEKEEAVKDGDEEYAKSLTPTKRVLVALIDRDREDEGVLYWAMPWTLDRDICKLSLDKRTGEAFYIDDPEEGYDVDFERIKDGPMYKYSAPQVARRSSPLGKDEWLETAVENPLPKLLVYHDYDRMKKMFGGGAAGGSSKKDSSKDKEVDYTWDDIHAMSMDDMDDVVERLKLKDINPEDFDDEPEYADAICEELGIEEPKKEDDNADANLKKHRRRRS